MSLSNNGTMSAWLFVAALGCSGSASLGGGGDAGVGSAGPFGTGGATQLGDGGALGTGGKRSTGGDCALLECFRAYECVEECGGPLVSSGCCPCSEGTVDRVTACVGAGGGTSLGGGTAVGGGTAAGGGTAVGGSPATGGASNAGYTPCGGKKCGDVCTVCPPNSTTCVETNLLKACDLDGACIGSSLVQCGATGGAAGTGGTTSTSTYQPCAGKQCGDNCTLCPPNSTDCGETAVMKSCNLAGQCLAGTQQCTVASGGTSGAGGSTGAGGYTYVCDLAIVCVRAYVCVESCEGPVIGSGCCQCPSGTFDQLAHCSSGTGGARNAGGAPATGGSAAAGGNTGGTKCGAAVCDANEECCNASCSLCVPKGSGCVAMECTTGGSTSLGGSTSTSTGITGLHEPCTDKACPSGLTPVEFYGIAGSSGPLFCSCEIPCSETSTTPTCPSGMSCTYVADGPGPVCY